MIFNQVMPNSPNVSLVALYGNKPPHLTNCIQQLQSYLSAQLQEQFEPYQLEQIHGTIIGYKGVKTDKGILSQWFWEYRDEEKYINLSASIDYIHNTNLLPLKIGFNGYQPNFNYGFFSQNKSLFERSFQFINNFAVLIGWPVQEEQIVLDLYKLRLGFQQFNLLHKYHRKADSLDNDFYMALGILKVKPSDEKLRVIENEIRNKLKASSSLYVFVDLKNISFVRYQDPTLPLATTKIVLFQEASVAQIELLYP